ncbi:MAG: hypothetical protein ACRDRN_16555 [Sciscionella sp.]
MSITDSVRRSPSQLNQPQPHVLDPVVPSMPSRDLGWTKWAGDDLDGATQPLEMTIMRGID